MALRSSQLSPRWQNWLGNACLVGFALGSPLLLLLGNLSIYDEAIIWGLGLVARRPLFRLPISNSGGRRVNPLPACLLFLRGRSLAFPGDLRCALPSDCTPSCASFVPQESQYVISPRSFCRSERRSFSISF